MKSTEKTRKDNVDKLRAAGVMNLPPDTEILKALANTLLEALYRPVVDERVTVRDAARCEELGIEEEPINWGALRCSGMMQLSDGGFRATIEEAAPDECPTLCGYVEKYLTAWGWNVSVETEW